MKDSIKNKILNFLQENPGWQYGGVIEDFIRSTDGHKASNASRRARELEDEQKVESRYVRIPGVANLVVQYRLKIHPLEEELYQTYQKAVTGHKLEDCYSFKKFGVGCNICRVVDYAKDGLSGLF